MGETPVPDRSQPAQTQAQKFDPPMSATTTGEDDRRTAGQRRVNIIWELTQAFVAIFVTGTGMIVAALLALRLDPVNEPRAAAASIAAFVFLTGVVNLVIGFYFGRTNHQRMGGVGGDSGQTR